MKTKFLILFALTVIGICGSGESANLNKEAEKKKEEENMRKDFSLFSNIFNVFTPQPSQEQSDQDNSKLNKHLTRSIFNPVFNSPITNSRDDKQVVDLKEEPLLPYQMLLARTKKPTFVQFDKLPQNFGAAGRRGSQPNQFQLLNKFLTEMENNQEKGEVAWLNPRFHDKEKGQKLPNFKIFGQKEKGKKKHLSVNVQQIEELLKQKVPFLEEGKILTLHPTVHKKGILLKIAYAVPNSESIKDTVYEITARYKPRKNHLEIISLKEKNSPFQDRKNEDIVVDEESEQENGEGLDFKDKYQGINLPDQNLSNNPTQNQDPQQPQQYRSTGQKKKSQQKKTLKDRNKIENKQAQEDKQQENKKENKQSPADQARAENKDQVKIDISNSGKNKPEVKPKATAKVAEKTEKAETEVKPKATAKVAEKTEKAETEVKPKATAAEKTEKAEAEVKPKATAAEKTEKAQAEVKPKATAAEKTEKSQVAKRQQSDVAVKPHEDLNIQDQTVSTSLKVINEAEKIKKPLNSQQKSADLNEQKFPLK